MRVNKGYLIDAAAQTITVVDWRDFHDLKLLIGGYLEVAMNWPKGSVLYVDEEGLLKPQEHHFLIKGQPQPLAGNGVVTGPDRYTRDGEEDGSYDPEMSLACLTSSVTFLTHTL